jgi:hypothetical protein
MENSLPMLLSETVPKSSQIVQFNPILPSSPTSQQKGLVLLYLSRWTLSCLLPMSSPALPFVGLLRTPPCFLCRHPSQMVQRGLFFALALTRIFQAQLSYTLCQWLTSCIRNIHLDSNLNFTLALFIKIL